MHGAVNMNHVATWHVSLLTCIKRVYLPQLINYMMKKPQRDSRVADASDSSCERSLPSLKLHTVSMVLTGNSSGLEYKITQTLSSTLQD